MRFGRVAGQTFRHGNPLTTTPEAIPAEAIPAEAIPAGAIQAGEGNAHFADNPCLFTGKMLNLRPHNFRAG